MHVGERFVIDAWDEGEEWALVGLISPFALCSFSEKCESKCVGFAPDSLDFGLHDWTGVLVKSGAAIETMMIF